MKKPLLIALAAIPIIGFGQSPIITQENVYLLGDETEIAICLNPVEPGNSGTDITWDFTNLVENEEQSFIYLDPEETLWGYEFPEATLCGVSWDGSHSYYRVEADNLIVEGFGSLVDGEPSDSIKVLFTDTEELVPLPFEYGDTNFDTFDGTTEAAGFSIPFTGDIDFEVDGYGTLMLPNGTYTNAIRYHFNRSQTNTFAGQSTTTTKEQWAWMSPDYRFWLLLMEINDDGFGESELVWYAKNPLSVPTSINELTDMKIDIFPNPLKGNESISFNYPKSEYVNVELFTTQGRRVSTSTIMTTEGLNQIQFERELSSGLYVFKIYGNDQTYSSKLVVE